MDSRTKICEMRRNDPSISMATMAKEIGITRERVRQLLQIMRMPTVPKHPERAALYRSEADALDIAPTLLWIMEEMVRPAPRTKMKADRPMPRQMAAFVHYANQVVKTAREAMESDPTGWERYLEEEFAKSDNWSVKVI